MSAQNVIAGAGAGFAMGGPVGAVIGGLGGLFGGGKSKGSSSSTQIIDRRKLTFEEKIILSKIGKAMPGLIDRLSGAEMDKLLTHYTGLLREQGMKEVDRVFQEQRDYERLQSVRTGGSLGSVQATRDAERTRKYGEAAGAVDTTAALGAEQILGQRFQTTAGAVGTMSGAMSNIYGSQYATKTRTTGTQQATDNSFFNSAIQGALYGVTSPDSWWNTKGPGA